MTGVWHARCDPGGGASISPQCDGATPWLLLVVTWWLCRLELELSSARARCTSVHAAACMQMHRPVRTPPTRTGRPAHGPAAGRVAGGACEACRHLEQGRDRAVAPCDLTYIYAYTVHRGTVVSRELGSMPLHWCLWVGAAMKPPGHVRPPAGHFAGKIGYDGLALHSGV